MNLNDFDEFLCNEIFPAIQETLNIKSGDYSDQTDKLYNFKLQARMDGITPIEALEGNWRKHRSSLLQGLDELRHGKARPYEWWLGKSIDSINYNILLLALLKEFFDWNSLNKKLVIGKEVVDDSSNDNLSKNKVLELPSWCTYGVL